MTTQGGVIDLEPGFVRLTGNVVLDTTGNGHAAGANVTLAGFTDGDGVAPRALTINAGTGGDVTLFGVNAGESVSTRRWRASTSAAPRSSSTRW